MTARHELCMPVRVAHIDTHRLIPPVGGLHEMWGSPRPELHDQLRQRIAAILVLLSSETMPGHHDTASEDLIVGIQVRRVATFVRLKKALHGSAPAGIEFLRNMIPIDGFDAFGQTMNGLFFDSRDHAVRSRSSSSRLRSTPHRYPDNPPSLRTTRWQGIATASEFAPHACATARTDAGAPMRLAMSV